MPGHQQGRRTILIVALIIVLILGGVGFDIHVLWWVALAALVIWLLGFGVRASESAGRRRRRWYYW